MPKVTVLMAVFNGERYVGEAIEGILSQTFEDFEFLIVDDGSTDRSREIILSFADRRIRLVDNEHNLGLTRSLNRGLLMARGQYVARQDADDLSIPERLARQVQFLETHSDVALLGTWYEKIDLQGSLIGKRKLPCEATEIRWSLLFYCPFVHSAVMFRRQAVLEKVGLYNEALSYSQDYELWYRIARCLPVANLDEYLVKYRVSPRSMTATYGDRTQEGLQLRAATVANLLRWEGQNTRLHEERFRRLYAFLFGSASEPDPHDFRTAGEILRLHAAFCRSFHLSRRACMAHGIHVYRAVLSRLFNGSRFFQTAGFRYR